MIRTTSISIIILFGILMLDAPALAQEKRENVLLHPHKFYRKFFPKLKVKRNPPDSLYIKTYPNYLSVGVHVLSPAVRMNIIPRKKNESFDASSSFRTNVSDIIGISASYRFVSAGFAFLVNSGMNMHDNYASSRYRTATIKYNSAATSLQFKYLRIRGFTDVNQSNNSGQMFTRRPDMVSKEYQFEGIKNFSWKKYSYIGPLTFSQRQIKSRYGFLLKAGVYYNQLSADSAIISSNQKEYFEDFDDVTTLRSLSLRLAPGIGSNLVFFRKIYFSIAVFSSFDLYLYKYLKQSDEKVSGKHALVFLLDGKASLGYQSKRLYAGLRYEAESRSGILYNIENNTLFTYAGIELGYRFDAPKSVKKVYKKTMPPGM